MSVEGHPQFNDTCVLYQTDGTANKFGGVEVYADSLASYGQAYGIDPWLLIGEGTNPRDISRDSLTSFQASNIHIVKERYPGTDDKRGIIDRINGYIDQVNGAENYIAPWPSDDIRIHLRNLVPDLVHSMHPWQPQHGGRINRMITEVSATTGDIARVGTYHIDSNDMIANLAVRAAGRIDRKGLDRFDAMIAASPVAAAHMRKTGYYHGEVEVIPNPVDVEWYANAERFSIDEIAEQGARIADQYIVFVGRPDDRKGLGELLTAHAELTKQLPEMFDVELVVCGDGPNLPHYQEQASELGIKNVSFLGRVSHEDKARWLKTADLAVFPAKHGECQGIVLLEAMAAGAGAVIGGDNPGYAFTFEKLPSRDLALFDANINEGVSESDKQRKLNEFVERMYVLLTNDRVRRDLHVEQQRLVRNVFDIRVAGRQVLEVYDRVLHAA